MFSRKYTFACTRIHVTSSERVRVGSVQTPANQAFPPSLNDNVFKLQFKKGIGTLQTCTQMGLLLPSPNLFKFILTIFFIDIFRLEILSEISLNFQIPSQMHLNSILEINVTIRELCLHCMTVLQDSLPHPLSLLNKTERLTQTAGLRMSGRKF